MQRPWGGKELVNLKHSREASVAAAEREGGAGCGRGEDGGRSHSMENCDKGLDYSQLINVTLLSLSFSACRMRLLMVPLGILRRVKERAKCAVGFV